MEQTDYIVRKCLYCGKSFTTTNRSQLYCSENCRVKMNNKRKVVKRQEQSKEKKQMLALDEKALKYNTKCNREFCAHYNGRFANNCDCLDDISKEYIKKCSFYKRKSLAKA